MQYRSLPRQIHSAPSLFKAPIFDALLLHLFSQFHFAGNFQPEIFPPSTQTDVLLCSDSPVLVHLYSIQDLKRLFVVHHEHVRLTELVPELVRFENSRLR